MSLFQPSLFEQSTRVNIALDEDHELVKLARITNWTMLISTAANIRSLKVKRETGPTPRYRALIGAVVLMALRKINFREAEDLISHYAPARYLCELMDSEMTVDHVSIFEFTQMLGEEGVAEINNEFLQAAVDNGLADPQVLMSDTTAQEAKIPYPTEVGLMSRYMDLAGKAVKALGGKFKGIKGKVRDALKKVKGLARNSNLFAKSKEQKGKIGRKMYRTVKEVHDTIADLLASGYKLSSKAGQELTEMTNVMETLLPQMWHFLKTGFVAKGKILHLKMTDIYSIVRGKAGKRVEFGLKWGINRIGGGFVQGFTLADYKHASDLKFCQRAWQLHEETFGKVPGIFGFDRGGYSKANVKRAKKAGIKHVGIAPKGRAKWSVGAKRAERIRCERAQVEGVIGSLKSIYGFNKPNARSSSAMARYGQRAILGFNMRKLVRELTAMEAAAAAN